MPGLGAAFPYRLLDRIVVVEPGVRAVGTKAVSANEPYFAGHFPGAPVLPGVLICEALVELGARLVFDGAGGRLARVDKARFRRPVVPGDVLRLEVTPVAGRDRLRGVVHTGDVVVAEVEFAVEPPRGPRIHPTAVVSPGAELDEGVCVGPYAVVGPYVRVGRDGWIGPHAVVEGRTTLGARVRVFQFASVGAVPQDLKYRGEPSTVEIGDDTTVREHASLQLGTAPGGMRTTVGTGCLLMVGAHVAHDCQIGNAVILANGAALGGHVVAESHAIVGALAGVHQFVRLGESSLCAAGAMVSKDVPSFCTVAGDRARLYGLNTVGLRRRGFSPETRAALKRAYRELFGGGSWRANAGRVSERLGHVPEVGRLVAFVTASRRGVCR
ncbi:MAG: acyl-ACP--UDP-N-acetylglucosamine O-acyltransferase [Candidatus Binatia bacterium]